MINGHQADTLIRHTSYGAINTKERENYYRVCEETRNSFLDYLKETYAKEIPPEIESKISTMAWDRSHAEGYASIEREYEDIARFANYILSFKE